jgi:hypothetical protein
MALCHKWGVKTGFSLALRYFMLPSDRLGHVTTTNNLEQSSKKSVQFLEFQNIRNEN